MANIDLTGLHQMAGNYSDLGAIANELVDNGEAIAQEEQQSFDKRHEIMNKNIREKSMDLNRRMGHTNYEKE